MATDARPDRIVALFPGAVYENRFGTVAVRRDDDVFEITTFRTEHDYADFRRPHRVEFGDDVIADLARRDFTVNAIAWGRAPGDPGPNTIWSTRSTARADLAARRLRAVGDPDARFREDALRMIRAVRLAAALDFEIEPQTLAAIRANAGLVAPPVRRAYRRGAGEAAGGPDPVGRPAACPGHRAARRHLAGARRAARASPRTRCPGEDLWDHTLRSVDAAPADRPVVRLAALLHDIGKPATLSDGHFHHHDVVGARLAEALLRRLRYPRAAAEEVTHLIRHHMFTVDPDATDAAVRRFIKRIGLGYLDALFALRRADDIGSDLPPDDPAQARVPGPDRGAELAAEVALDRNALAIDGRRPDASSWACVPGPRLGGVLEALVERVIADPALNDRATLMLLAHGMLADMLPDVGDE